MSILNDIRQDTPEWLQLRKKKLGASDAPIIMGVSPWKTRFQLWEEKVGIREKDEENASMKRGKEMEEEARHVFEFETGLSVTPKVLLHAEHDFMMASLDGIDATGKYIVEIKCPGPIDHRTALDGEVPKKYYPQLQHQIEVSGVESLYYFSYSRSNYKIIEVKRDNDYIRNLLTEEMCFWKRVLNGDPPDLSDKDYQERFDDQWHHAVHQWKHTKSQLEAWKNQEDLARKHLITLSGGLNVKGAGIKLSKMIRKGPINYPEIPELSVVNLEKYRKAPIEAWRILDY